MSSTTNWWQQAKKSHTKLQTAARRSAPLSTQNADEGSRFVECPACGASMGVSSRFCKACGYEVRAAP